MTHSTVVRVRCGRGVLCLDCSINGKLEGCGWAVRRNGTVCTNRWLHPPCEICSEPFTSDEWVDRHWWGAGSTHSQCCPQCQEVPA